MQSIRKGTDFSFALGANAGDAEAQFVGRRKSHRLALHDRPTKSNCRLITDLHKPARTHSRTSGIAGVESVNVFDKDTPRFELLRQKQGSQIGTTSTQNRPVSRLITTDKAREHHHGAFGITV